jgi:hypothetical protein
MLQARTHGCFRLRFNGANTLLTRALHPDSFEANGMQSPTYDGLTGVARVTDEHPMVDDRLKNRLVHNIFLTDQRAWSTRTGPSGFLSMLNKIPPPLLQPRRLGDLLLPNRVVTASLTRGRASNFGHGPDDLMREYPSLLGIPNETAC